MKSYILTLQFENIEPVVWRKVIVPGGITFNRLHDVIQNVTNFQSGYPYEPIHLFEFQLDDVVVTNNLQRIDEAKSKSYKEISVKHPSRIKIDTYLERMGEFLYAYDFGDDWRIHVKLEEVVEDYYFGFPTVLDGVGEAPPEDVGGPPGFEHFLEAYQNPFHPEHHYFHSWAIKQGFRLFDKACMNQGLKHFKYQKTEWDKVHHENYRIISDKYIDITE
ncbi:plasmid pRiA4b ORF-3 family protein [Viridibacillus sp. NPDC096237]|uniref:plasmid pRiA4b ORF-3 family protein n=1 Tax=Viridibacillus sp. NPDC096237 TaxID=3390721 RepID=UPI003D090F54